VFRAAAMMMASLSATYATAVRTSSKVGSAVISNSSAPSSCSKSGSVVGAYLLRLSLVSLTTSWLMTSLTSPTSDKRISSRTAPLGDTTAAKSALESMKILVIGF
jgi:hypothetical protein